MADNKVSDPQVENLSSVTVSRLGFDGWPRSPPRDTRGPGRGLERGLTQASWHYLALVKQLSRPGGRYLLLLPLSIHLDVKTFMSSFHLNILQRLIGENPKTFVAVNL